MVVHSEDPVMEDDMEECEGPMLVQKLEVSKIIHLVFFVVFDQKCITLIVCIGAWNCCC